QAVALFRCRAATTPGSTRVQILPGCPNRDRSSRVAVTGFEPRTFQAASSCSTHVKFIFWRWEAISHLMPAWISLQPDKQVSQSPTYWPKNVELKRKNRIKIIQL
ncbi:hypothetical protein T265_14437, partial [Opisthorchis viverrini]